MNDGATFRPRRQRPFLQIDKEIIQDNRLSLSALGLGIKMLNLNPDKYYSLKYIKWLAGVGHGIGRDKFYALLKELIDAGYLQRSQSHEDRGKFGRNDYIIVDVLQEQPDTAEPDTAEPDTAEPDTVEPDTAEPDTAEPDTVENTYVYPSKIDINNTPYNPPEGDGAEGAVVANGNNHSDRFEKFWTFYRDTVCAADHGRAGGKAAARKAWDKLKPDKAQVDRLAAWLEAQIKTEYWQRGIGIPYAATLLNKIRRGEITLELEAQSQEQPRLKKWMGTQVIDGEEVDVFG